MKIISHRGNLFGPDPKTENTKKQIELAIKHGFDVEVDLWVIDGKLYLGHDEPTHKITTAFLFKYNFYLWIHCKNLEALVFLNKENEKTIKYNYFWHEKDKVTLTSLGTPWCYPETYVNGGITVVWGSDYQEVLKQNPKILGICTDYAVK